MSDAEQEEDMSRVKKACEELGEHFDTVQIFATRFDPQEGTTNINWGSGHYHARFGHIRQWLIKEERRFALQVEREPIEDE